VVGVCSYPDIENVSSRSRFIRSEFRFGCHETLDNEITVVDLSPFSLDPLAVALLGHSDFRLLRFFITIPLRTRGDGGGGA